MATTVEDTSTVNATSPVVDSVVGGSPNLADVIDDVTFQGMLDILDELTNHTHIFYDDYSTACNCNCVCACTRGII